MSVNEQINMLAEAVQEVSKRTHLHTATLYAIPMPVACFSVEEYVQAYMWTLRRGLRISEVRP